jgi:hypothetical protein
MVVIKQRNEEKGFSQVWSTYEKPLLISSLIEKISILFVRNFL